MNLNWQPIPDLCSGVRTVHQNGCARGGYAKDVDPVQEAPLVHADERRPVDQIGALDRLRIEPQMAHRHRTRLLRVVDEVRLHEQITVLADDLRGVLVRPDRAIGTEPIEHSADSRVVGRERSIERETGVRDVVDDADREPVAWSFACRLVEDRFYHRGRELFAAEPVPTADDARGAAVAPAARR